MIPAVLVRNMWMRLFAFIFLRFIKGSGCVMSDKGLYLTGYCMGSLRHVVGHT